MAINRIYKFPDIVEAELFLNGAVVGRAGAEKGFAVVGKKLHFTVPSAVTVTFTTGSNPNDPYTLTFKDVKTQVEAAVSTLKVLTVGGKIVFKSATGVTIHPTDADDANTLFGLDPVNDTVGKIFHPMAVSTTPPCWVEFTVNESATFIYTWE